MELSWKVYVNELLLEQAHLSYKGAIETSIKRVSAVALTGLCLQRNSLSELIHKEIKDKRHVSLSYINLLEAAGFVYYTGEKIICNYCPSGDGISAAYVLFKLATEITTCVIKSRYFVDDKVSSQQAARGLCILNKDGIIIEEGSGAVAIYRINKKFLEELASFQNNNFKEFTSCSLNNFGKEFK